jgi:putative oligomerization/nucleic acid binding protein
VKGRSAIGNFFLVGGLGLAGVGVVMMATGGLGSAMGGGILLMIGVIWALVALLLRAIYGGMARRMTEEKQLFESGRQAEGVVKSLETTGLVVNEVNSQVRITVEVRPPGETPFEVTRKMLLPHWSMPRPGDTMRVAYDPANCERVAFDTDWGSDTAGGRLLVTNRQQAAPPPAPPPADERTAPDRMIERLEKLDQLRKSGVLTDAEFQAQKAKVLANP